MNGSILTSVKKSLGITEDFTDFDPDIIMAINSTLNILTQLGVGTKKGFQIEGDSEIWIDFIGDNEQLNMIKTYVCAKVRLIFDPPQLTSVTECLKEIVREFEFRINCEVDPPNISDEIGGDENGILCDNNRKSRRC